VLVFAGGCDFVVRVSVDTTGGDLQAGTTTRVTVDTGSGDANANTRHARISADGRHVVFASPASDLVSGDGNGDGRCVRARSRRADDDSSERAM
jgi:hypothetical protein